MERIGIVVHPRRDLRGALATIEAWAGSNGVALVQVQPPGAGPAVAPAGAAEDCDVVLAVGGDGTTLAAVHAAAPVGKPVMGVACGSLGALTAVTAEKLDAALEALEAGRWTARHLPGVVADTNGSRLVAANDIVLVRAGAGQVTAEIRIDGELLIRFAGDGVVAGTPLGSTAYTLASGGPMIVAGAEGMAITPLAPHGGVCPPVVTGPGTQVEVLLDPGYGGARVEVDGQVRAELASLTPQTFTLTYEREFATLVELGDHEPVLAGLRRRGIIVDSPRMTAREARKG
jgi:NAD+ kinase